MKKGLLLLLFSALIVRPSYSNTCSTSAGTFASWAALTWTCISVPTSGPPGCGDVMNISAGTTVNISADVDYSACATPISLNIYGTMNFNVNGVRFKLPPGSVVFVGAGGKITKSFPGGGSSTLISVGGTNVWTAGMGTVIGPIVLPVELINFTGTSNVNNIDLKWTTASEVNNDHFNLERSADAVNFQSIATIGGGGNSTSLLNYLYTDNNPLDGISYYRLKQTDYNGHYSYSNIIAINFLSDPEFSFNVFPNPGDGGTLNLIIITPAEKEKKIIISDIAGRVAFTSVLTDNISGIPIKLDIGRKLPSGIYLFRVEYQQKQYTRKMIVY